jgi:glucose-6-phosphate isomerase
VGLLPAALQGINIDTFLHGAREMDYVTRRKNIRENPAALLALSWYHLGNGIGSKAMVVLPYKDRLQLFSQYLQQLVMESLGKKLDRDGKQVYQGLTVYGNKGSTDQHAYVQQLRDGLNNFFVVFIEVLKDTIDTSNASDVAKFAAQVGVDDIMKSGDYLHGFCVGTRSALYAADRKSISISLNSLSERSVGALIALFERAVGLYAELININAYHQPGVQAGKEAAQEVLELERRIVSELETQTLSAEELAKVLKEEDSLETIFRVLRYLTLNGRLAVSSDENSLFDYKYSKA